MSQKEKLVARLLEKPKDFTYDEMVGINTIVAAETIPGIVIGITTFTNVFNLDVSELIIVLPNDEEKIAEIIPNTRTILL